MRRARTRKTQKVFGTLAVLFFTGFIALTSIFFVSNVVAKDKIGSVERPFNSNDSFTVIKNTIENGEPENKFYFEKGDFFFDDVIFIKENIDLFGTGDTGDTGGTNIVASSGKRHFEIVSENHIAPVVSNIKFSGSSTLNDTAVNGGIEISIPENSEALAVELINCVFRNNINNSGSGGAVNLKSGKLKVHNSIFENNSSSYGGAINGEEGSCLTITNSVFSKNRGSRAGGGIYAFNLQISNSTLYSNIAGRIGGGGISIENSGTVTNCTVVQNKVERASVGAGGGIFASTNSVGIKGTIVAENTAARNSEIQIGNIDFSANTGLTEDGNYNIIGYNADVNKNTVFSDSLADEWYMIKAGGTAHEVIPSSLDWTLETDQRGVSRKDQGELIDIGAIEITKAKNIIFEKEELTLLLDNKEVQLDFQVIDGEEDNHLIWKSENESVAKVNQNGLVSPVGYGKTEISVRTFSGTTAFLNIEIVDKLPIKVTGVTIDETTINLEEGDAYQLTAKVLPEDADNKEVMWSSNNDIIATVDSNGKVTGIREGNAEITVKTVDGDFSANCQVQVSRKPDEIIGVSIDKKEVLLNAGETEKLSATLVTKTYIDEGFIWESSNESLVTVSDNGNITASHENINGTAIITVNTADGKFSDTSTVTVSSVKLVPQGITDGDKIELGKTFELTFNHGLDTNSGKWECDSEIFKLDVSGDTAKVTPIKEGSGYIMYTLGDESVSLSLAVFDDTVTTTESTTSTTITTTTTTTTTTTSTTTASTTDSTTAKTSESSLTALPSLTTIKSETTTSTKTTENNIESTLEGPSGIDEEKAAKNSDLASKDKEKTGINIEIDVTASSSKMSNEKENIAAPKTNDTQKTAIVFAMLLIFSVAGIFIMKTKKMEK